MRSLVKKGRYNPLNKMFKVNEREVRYLKATCPNGDFVVMHGSASMVL